MTDRPIIFSAPMVRALLDGRKTQTRRLLKLPDLSARRGEWEASTIGGAGVSDASGRPVPERACVWHTGTGKVIGPVFTVSDRLYVRENWQCHAKASDVATIVYQATINRSWTETHDQFPVHLPSKLRARPFQQGWSPSIHMPRWASRLTLTVTDVRVQRLQDISEEDAIAEGCKVVRDHCYVFEGTRYDQSRLCHGSPTTAFSILWDELHGQDAWNDNPWIVALTFTVQQGNIDALPKPEAA